MQELRATACKVGALCLLTCVVILALGRVYSSSSHFQPEAAVLQGGGRSRKMFASNARSIAMERKVLEDRHEGNSYLANRERESGS